MENYPSTERLCLCWMQTAKPSPHLPCRARAVAQSPEVGHGKPQHTSGVRWSRPVTSLVTFPIIPSSHQALVIPQLTKTQTPSDCQTPGSSSPSGSCLRVCKAIETDHPIKSRTWHIYTTSGSHLPSSLLGATLYNQVWLRFAPGVNQSL